MNQQSLSQGMTLAEASELFLSQYKKSSRISYGSQLIDLCRFYPDDKTVISITAIELVHYMASVDKRPEVQSPVTYNKYVKVMRTFFNWCVKMDLIDKSPAKPLKIKNTRHTVPRSKAMPEAVLYRILDFAEKWEVENADPRPLALFRFLSDTGCRAGGAATLTRDRLKLNEPIRLQGETIYMVLLFEKGRPEPNTYYFSEETAKVLRRLLLKQSGQFVFGRNGDSILSNSLQHYFRKFCKRAKCGNWGPHSLRHAKGHAAAKEFPLSVAAKLLNDTEQVFVQYYSPKEDRFIQGAAAELFAKQVRNKRIINLSEKTG